MAAAIVIGLIAMGLRLWRYDSTFDVFVDEFVYTDLGRSSLSGLPALGADGPFFLHPPGFFYLLGGWDWLTARSGSSSPVARVFDARTLNCVLGGVSAGLMVWICGRHSVRWGVVAGLLFALEPFALRQNGRVLLETSTLTWVLLGYALLLSRSPDAPSRRRSAAAGLALGCAVLTKDVAIVVTAAPLLGAWLLSRRRTRGTWAPTALIMIPVPYAVYAVCLTVSGHLGAWLDSKYDGIRRMTGAEVTTGFSAAGAPSLSEQIVGQLRDFGATYALLALGGIGALALLRRGTESDRLVALLYLCAAATMAYSLTAGTVEEQFLYLLLIPAVLAFSSWGRLLSAPPSRPDTRHRRSRASIALQVALALLMVANIATYARWHSRSDDAYVQVRAYLATHAEAGTGIVTVNGTSEFALGDRYQVGPFTTDALRAQHDVRYLLVPSKEVDQGYTYVSRPDVDALRGEGQLVLEYQERTYGLVQLYLLPPPSP